MSITARLSFDVSATGSDLRLQVILDGQIIWDDFPGRETQTVNHDFDDGTEQDHVLEFHMLGKLPEHTRLDAEGTIIEDRCIQITDITFDEIVLGQIVTKIAEYCHDHNGTTEAITDQFFGVMGCNGQVRIRFTTPIYLWLLETM